MIDPEQFLEELQRLGPEIAKNATFSVYDRIFINFACMVCWWLAKHEPEQLGHAIGQLNAQLDSIGKTLQ